MWVWLKCELDTARRDLSASLFVLCFVVAGLAAIQAVIISVLHQAHVVFALAEHAIVFHFALALPFRLVALQAHEWGSHTADSTSNHARKKASGWSVHDC